MSALPQQRAALGSANRSPRWQQANRRTRRALWLLATLVAAAMLAASMQGGCAAADDRARLQEYDYAHQRDLARDRDVDRDRLARQTGGAGAPSPAAASRVAFDAPDDPPPAEPIAPHTQALLDQGQRDVEMLLAARQKAAASGAAPLTEPAAPVTAASTIAGETPNMPRRVVVWNDIKPPAPSESAGPALAESPGGEASSSIGEPTASVEPASESSPPTAASALQGDRLRQLAVDLARELYAAGAYSDQPLRELAVIAAMHMVDPERRLDPSAIPDLTEQEREVLATLQRFFADLEGGLRADAGGDIAQRVADAAAALRQALVREPTLAAPVVALCTRVGGFGDYTPFEQYVFPAGVENKAIVYLEVEDFVSEINNRSEYVTELSQQLTLLSERDGLPAWKQDWQNALDVTRNKRQDFFTVQVISLPKNLAIGRYVLKVRIRDEKSKAETETSVNIDIVAP